MTPVIVLLVAAIVAALVMWRWLRRPRPLIVPMRRSWVMSLPTVTIAAGERAVVSVDNLAEDVFRPNRLVLSTHGQTGVIVEGFRIGAWDQLAAPVPAVVFGPMMSNPMMLDAMAPAARAQVRLRNASTEPVTVAGALIGERSRS